MGWYDVIMRDLKKCNLVPDWCDAAHDRAIWREFVGDGATELNSFFLKEGEKKRKDEERR